MGETRRRQADLRIAEAVAELAKIASAPTRKFSNETSAWPPTKLQSSVSSVRSILIPSAFISERNMVAALPIFVAGYGLLSRGPEDCLAKRT